MYGYKHVSRKAIATLLVLLFADPSVSMTEVGSAGVFSIDACWQLGDNWIRGRRDHSGLGDSPMFQLVEIPRVTPDSASARKPIGLVRNLLQLRRLVGNSDRESRGSWFVFHAS